MQPTFFINHGGGPCFFLEPGPMRDAWSELEAYLSGFAAALEERPRALLVVSGHWEEARPTVNVGAAPPLLFNYGGFPPHTYELTWPAPGDPELAGRVRDLIDAAGIDSGSDAARGWDHGVFVPLKVIFPGADIPTVQLSLQQGLDPAAHLVIGRALTPLRREGVLIVGSGLTYHNLRAFGPQAHDVSTAFDDWLNEAVVGTKSAQRDEKLLRWSTAPAARIAHPREEHLIPLMVAVGAAQDEPGERIYHEDDFMGGIAVSSFRFG